MTKPMTAKSHAERLMKNPEELELIVAEHMMFRQAIEHSPLPFALCDPNDVLILWNDAYARLHKPAFDKHGEQAKLGKLHNADIIESCAPKELSDEERKQYIANQIKRETCAEGVWFEQYYDGPGWYRVVKYKTPSGAVAGIATNIDDLKKQSQARKQARKLAEEAQFRFKEAVSILDDGFVIFDENDKMITCNEAFREQFGDAKIYIQEGLTYREMTLNLAKSGLIPNVEGREEEFVDGLVEKRRSEEGYSNTFQRHDGRWIRQRDKRTSAGDLVGIRTDITNEQNQLAELTKAKAAIEETKERLVETTSAMVQGLVVYEDDKIVLFNEKAMELLGVDETILFVGQTIENFFQMQLEHGCYGTGEKAQYYADLSVKTIRAKESFYVERRANNGKYLKIDGVGNGEGRLVTTLTDITELKNSKTELQRGSKLLQDTTDAMAQGLLVIENNEIALFNKKAMELLGIDETILFKGNKVLNFMRMQKDAGFLGTNEEADAFIEKHSELIKSGQPYQSERITHVGRHIRVDGVPNDNGGLVLTYTDMTELKEREAEVQKTSNLLLETTSAMDQGMIILNDDRIEFFNESAGKLMNLPEGILRVGIHWREVVDFQYTRSEYGEGEAALEFHEKVVRVIESKQPHELERKSTKGTIVRTNFIPSGENGLLITFSDVTAIKRHEEQIEKTSKLLLETTEATTQGMIVLEGDKIEFFNHQVKELLSLPDEILHIGGSWDRFVEYQDERGDYGEGKEKSEAFHKKVKSYIANRESYEVERKSANGKTLKVNGGPCGENGWLLTFTDISEMRERELEVRKTSELLQDTTDTMAQGLVIFGETDILFANPRAAEILNVPSDILAVGNRWEAMLEYQYNRGDYGPGDEGKAKFLNLVRMIKEKEPHNLERTNNDGRILRIDGAPSGHGNWIVIYTDISDIKAREKHLEQAMKTAELAERAKSEFLANMSHEIRTPMNGVMGMAELLAMTELDPKQKMFTDVIVKSGASLLTIINDILDFSKIDAGQMELDPAPFNLAEAIEDVATLVSSKVSEKDLELIVRIDPNLPKLVVGDVGRIRQIVTNLMGNAVKFTEKGHVYINVDGSVQQNDGNNLAHLTFSVEDTGIGIPEDKLQQVFQKFSQVDTSATRKHEGTGLGLSIASSLVELMGGVFEVKSEFGIGSTFSFSLALPVHTEDLPTQTVPGDVRGSRVLIIDDNKVNRSILLEQMKAWQFDSAAASSGPEGLEVMRAVIANGLPLDLVILDYQMPEMCGADVLEVIRSDEALKHIPVMVLTSIDRSEATQRLNDLGVDANLTKPTRSSLLFETMVQIISNHRANAQDQQSIEPNIKLVSPTPVTQEETSGYDQTPAKVPVLETTSTANDEMETSGTRTQSQLDILVAEDNEVNQIVIQQILEPIGLNFEIVGNGKLALETFKTKHPKLILMDISMPEMNGKEATANIRQFERENSLQPTPIIGVTAHALKGDMESCFEVGMDDYLSKPVSPNALSEKVEKWLQNDCRLIQAS